MGTLELGPRFHEQHELGPDVFFGVHELGPDIFYGVHELGPGIFYGVHDWNWYILAYYSITLQETPRVGWLECLPKILLFVTLR